MDTEGKKDDPGDAGWWSKLPNGATRRIWVARHGGNYACRVTIDGSNEAPAVREHVTPRREEALEFLGNDDLAHSALSAADSGPERTGT